MGNGQWAMGKQQGLPALVEMKERFGNLALNVVVRAIAGKRYFGTHACGDEPKRAKKAFEDFIILLGLFMVSDVIPFLGWLDTMKGFTAEMKRVAKEVDYVLGSWVEDHRQNRLSANDNGAEQDFIHAMLSVIDDGQFSGRDPDTIIKGTCSVCPCYFHNLSMKRKEKKAPSTIIISTTFFAHFLNPPHISTRIHQIQYSFIICTYHDKPGGVIKFHFDSLFTVCFTILLNMVFHY